MGPGEALLARQLVERHEAEIVAGAGILGSWVAQTHDEGDLRFAICDLRF
jgi:hypothetical protein